MNRSQFQHRIDLDIGMNRSQFQHRIDLDFEKNRSRFQHRIDLASQPIPNKNAKFFKFIYIFALGL